MGWISIEELYKYTTAKYTYNIIHSEDNHYFKEYLLANRNDQKRLSNKLGPHKTSIGRSNYTFYTYLYQSIDIYNNIPDNITRMTRPSLFKIWTKKFMKNNKINIPVNKLNPLNQINDPPYLEFPVGNLCE